MKNKKTWEEFNEMVKKKHSITSTRGIFTVEVERALKKYMEEELEKISMRVDKFYQDEEDDDIIEETRKLIRNVYIKKQNMT